MPARSLAVPDPPNADAGREPCRALALDPDVPEVRVAEIDSVRSLA